MKQNRPPQFNFSTHMVMGPASGIGYHTRLPEGMMVHHTRDTINWAYAQLVSEDPALRGPAIRAIDQVISLQDSDSSSPTYGIWPWTLEEPLHKMSPPDWNWADFIGLGLCKILKEYVRYLPDATADRAKQALFHAAQSIFRRNVDSGYSNICAMGAAVCGGAGELLDLQYLSDYATHRLSKMWRDAESAGSFSEYNSPTYYAISIESVEFILMSCEHQPLREVAAGLHRWIWQQIADFFHPATAEWGGPHARSYGDSLKEASKKFLGERGIPMFVARLQGQNPSPVARSCPADLIPCFTELPEEPLIVQKTLPKHGQWNQPSDRILTQVKDGRFSLGSINREDTWVQRRNLIGYGRCLNDENAILRSRFSHNGKDFASGFVRQAQDDFAVLSLFSLVTGRGLWHCSLDRPEDGCFALGTLKIAYELIAEQAQVLQHAENRFELTAGGLSASVITGPAQIDGREVAWHCQELSDRVLVYCESSISTSDPIKLEELGPTFAVGGVAWHNPAAPFSLHGLPEIHLDDDAGLISAQWGDHMRVEAPVTAQPYQ